MNQTARTRPGSPTIARSWMTSFYLHWRPFRPGVRIVVLSDSCYGGSVTKRIEDEDVPNTVATAEAAARHSPRFRALPRDKMIARYRQNAELYDGIQKAVPARRRRRRTYGRRYSLSWRVRTTSSRSTASATGFSPRPSSPSGTAEPGRAATSPSSRRFGHVCRPSSGRITSGWARRTAASSGSVLSQSTDSADSGSGREPNAARSRGAADIAAGLRVDSL
jgi:hypothetical protein